MEPTQTKKIGTVCIVHGFGEHSGRFLDVAEAFVKKSFVVHLIDLRGFGLKTFLSKFNFVFNDKIFRWTKRMLYNS